MALGIWTRADDVDELMMVWLALELYAAALSYAFYVSFLSFNIRFAEFLNQLILTLIFLFRLY